MKRASIARDILAILVSNTSVERLFSSCQNTVTDKRTKLGAEKLNKIIFLQKNRKILLLILLKQIMIEIQNDNEYLINMESENDE